MHRDLFQPHNDTQTSLVFLRKWSETETAATHDDYPIFMAVADAIGHNKRGRTIHKRNDDGSLILEKVTIKKSRFLKGGASEEIQVGTMRPIIDDELDDVANSYLAWLEKTAARRRGSHGSA